MPDLEDIIPKPLVHIYNDNIQTVVKDLIKENINDSKTLQQFIREKRKKYNSAFGNKQLLYAYRKMLQENKIEKNKNCENILKAKASRGLSGVIVITVMTSPNPTYIKNGQKITQNFSCEFNCHFCPKEPGQPRSYLLDEPSVSRANRNNFDPILQFNDRAHAYEVNGHPLDKIELLILGGTWSSYPPEYHVDFITDIFYSANCYSMTIKRARLSLQEEQEANETAMIKIIGLTIETRPDQINLEEITRFRILGVTRVQLGIQHTDNLILNKINRQCTVETAIKAIKLLKDNGFKVDIHIMPDLPGSSYEKDLEMFKYILNSGDLQADQWKIYPCQVTPYTKIKDWYLEGNYFPYSDSDVKPNPLIELLINVKSKVPRWIRLNRIIRDIPNQYIIGGNKVTNLRQAIQTEMKKRNLRCECIKCREIKNNPKNITKMKFFTDTYIGSQGTEIFLQYASEDEKNLFGFLRLRLADNDYSDVINEIRNCALIRELHVYGQVVAVNSTNKDEVQHIGIGKKLIKKAEKIAISNCYNKIAVISGVGVKNYYRKIGFVDRDYYLIKQLDSNQNTYHMIFCWMFLIFYFVFFF